MMDNSVAASLWRQFSSSADVRSTLAINKICLGLQVTAVSELIIETWGIPNPSVFVRGQHAASGSGRQAAADSAKGRYLRVAGSLPAGSVFLGAVQVSKDVQMVAHPLTKHKCLCLAAAASSGTSLHRRSM